MSKSKVKPLGNRVLVKRSEGQKTKGGILLPDTAKEKPKQGEVIAVGPGKMDKQGNLQQMPVKVGDQILFTSYAGSEVKIDEIDAEYLIMSEDDILGVLV
jgi:chaperonin GroES